MHLSVARKVIESKFSDLGSPWNLLWPALATVAVVNVIIVLYIVRAFKEDKMEQDRSGENEPSKKCQ